MISLSNIVQILMDINEITLLINFNIDLYWLFQLISLLGEQSLFKYDIAI